MVSEKLMEILACPVPECRHHPLRYDAATERIICDQCGRRYPVRDGIPVMLIEEAEPGTPSPSPAA